jgi:hypothetical protein
VLLSGVLINRRARQALVATGDLFSIPDEVLEKVSLVLGKEEDLGLLDDLPQINVGLLLLYVNRSYKSSARAQSLRN